MHVDSPATTTAQKNCDSANTMVLMGLPVPSGIAPNIAKANRLRNSVLAVN
jgi:hypothetical protein